MTARSGSKRRTSEKLDKENDVPTKPAEELAEAEAVQMKSPSTDKYQMSDSELEKAFNCTKCQVKLKDVKLLKLHYWRVHITENEVNCANRMIQLSSNSLNKAADRLTGDSHKVKKTSSLLDFLTAESSTPNRKRKHRKSATKEEESQAKRKAVKSDDDDSNSVDSATVSKSESAGQESATDEEDQISEADSEKRELEDKLSLLTEEEIKYHNLDAIDEAKLAERAEKLNQLSNPKVSKIQELKNVKTVWACWYCHSRRSSVMWPAKIEKIAKDSSGKSKVFVKYYELNPKTANLFKMEAGKVEPFFKPVKDHFQYKELVTIHKPQRLEFFTCYTNALRDFAQELDEREKVQAETSSVLTSTVAASEAANPPVVKERYMIMGKSYTVEQIKELAHLPFSDATLEINRQRIAQSEKLFEALSSKACEDHIISIFTGQVKCPRHDTYMKADSTTRRTQLKFSSPGPLIVSHQESLAKLLEELSAKHYQEKPMHLKNYEYDVLYPESVIWALQKVDGLSYKKAESKYKMGFKRTEEEIIKSKCNEILNKIQKSPEEGEDMESTLETSQADQSVPHSNISDSKVVEKDSNVQETTNETSS